MTVLDHTEAAFEREIVEEMLTAGWKGETPVAGTAPADHRGYDAELGLYPGDLIDFVKATQPKAWEKVLSMAGADDSVARQSLLKRVATQIDKRGTVEVLRKGVTERGVTVKLCYFEPGLKADPTVEALYKANKSRVVRQVRFDPRSGDSVDLVLFVNGVPTATAELKNRFTGQSVDHAIKQYREDRGPKNTLFARRALVHFAVDSELAYMTTKLAGADTVFLPFNQGSAGAGEPGGKGNPSPADGSHPTAYLWREVWSRDAWLELIACTSGTSCASARALPLPMAQATTTSSSTQRAAARARRSPGSPTISRPSTTTTSARSSTRSWS
jgi:type I restriction enzyme R subunit